MREFKFFHGVKSYGLAAIQEPELNYDLNLYDSVIESISQDMQREIDEEMTRLVVRRINDGENNNFQYLNHYINMEGGNRA